MLKRILILLVLALSGCSQSGQNIGPYYIAPFPEEGRLLREAAKRDSLQLEDLTVETGPVAARGRRLTADIEVRYTDGTVVYRGTILSFPGFVDLVGHIPDSRLLSTTQEGIDLGLNGMAVGGKRRITVDRSLVCTTVKADADPGAACHLVGYDDFRNSVRKEKLLVEATLTESCLPIVLKVMPVQPPDRYVINGVAGCRDSETPKLDHTAPIWRFY